MTEHSNRLPILAEEIGRQHVVALEKGREFVAAAIECGHRLIEAKGLVTHGEWEPWLAANVPNMSGRTARRYMKAARLAGKSDTVAISSLRHLVKPSRRPKASPAPSGYLPRDIAPIPQPGEGLVASFMVTDPAYPPDDVEDRVRWTLDHRVGEAVAIIEPTTAPGFVWPAVVCASLPVTNRRGEDGSLASFWLGQKPVDAAGPSIGSQIGGDGGAFVPGVAAESAESILYHLYSVPVHRLRGRWRRYQCERQKTNRALALEGADPFDFADALLNNVRCAKGWPIEVSLLFAFAEDANGTWLQPSPKSQQSRLVTRKFC